MKRGPGPGVLFSGIAAAAVVFAFTLPLLLSEQGTDVPAAAIGVAAAFGTALFLGLLWLVMQRQLLAPARRLEADVRMLAQAGGETSLTTGTGFGALSPLAAAVADLSGRLAAVRADRERAVAEATRRAADLSDRLAALLRDLHEGVLVCNLRHQILLYNEAVRAMLPTTADLGLGRSLLHLVSRQPVQHTLERLVRRIRDGRHRDHADGSTAGFVTATAEGRLLHCRMAVILGGSDEVTGYVVTVEDATVELASLARRDALLRSATEDVRQPLANLGAAVGALADHPDLAAEERAPFDRIIAESSQALNRTLERITHEYRAGITASWPMEDIHSANLFALVAERSPGGDGPELIPTGLPDWLHGDSYSLVLLLSHLAGRVAEATGRRQFDLSVEADPERRFVFADLTWTGEPLGAARLNQWRADPLPEALAGLTVGDILELHSSDLWCVRHTEGCAKLRLPLPRPQEAHGRRGGGPAPRPEFFDFDLLHQPLPEGSLARQPLRSLSYVVFDTETTGLNPSQGDEMVALAGVRIVNGRILTGETFQTLINPGRAIPAASAAIHGITDAMVTEAPRAEAVLPQFRAFVGDAVLVAHNAAFDLKFLRLKQRAAGVRFDGPVLDTMILSRQIQGEHGEHSLDGLAARLGIGVVDRHSAMGDSLMTAAIFLRLMEMLETQGIRTLDDAIRRSNMAVELVARGRAF